MNHHGDHQVIISSQNCRSRISNLSNYSVDHKFSLLHDARVQYSHVSQVMEMASWNWIISWENAQGTCQCSKLPNPRKGGELGIVDLSTRGYELHLQNGPLGKKDLLTKLFWRWKMILLNQGYTKDADPLSHTWCKTSDYFGASEQTISSQIWRRIMRKQNDYLLFNHLPLSLQPMSNFVKDSTSFQRR